MSAQGRPKRECRSAQREGSPMSLKLTIFVAALASAPVAFGQTMYKCQDGAKTIYSDRPCLEGVEVKRISPTGGPTREDLARDRMKARADEQRVATERAAEKRAAPTVAGSEPRAGAAPASAPKATATPASHPK